MKRRSALRAGRWDGRRTTKEDGRRTTKEKGRPDRQPGGNL